jgi:topoisomerase-4 subunit A
MFKFTLTNIQAEAILNTRLRSLRKLEEQEIIIEHDSLEKDQANLQKILQDPNELKKLVKKEIKLVQTKFGFNSKLGLRRTNFEQADIMPQIVDISAFITKEPITIICSKMGWIRSLKGHNNDLSIIKYKEGDEQKFVIEAYTTDKILILSSEGRFFTILADNISKTKGNGESIKLIIDIGNADIVSILVYKLGQKFLLASNIGKGFIVSSDEVVAGTKLGKQIMQVQKDQACIICLVVNGDYVASIGENRKLLVFKLNEIAEMKRGQGVILQKFKDAKLVDVKIFDGNLGLSWTLGGKTRLEKDILPFLGKRGGVGKIPPTGFPKNNRFS